MANKSSKLPGWVWLLTGIVTGLFLAFLYYLAGIKPTGDSLLNTKQGTKTESTHKGHSGPKFDFYTLLPDREIVAPEEPANEAAQPPTKTVKPFQRSLIQTGSFRSAQEADQLRAELILMGLDVNIQTVELNPGESWHRVQVGPFESANALDKAKRTLAENKIEHIVLRLK